MPRAPYRMPMPPRAGRADREDALAEDRQQQQHAAGESPAGLDEHQRGHVRVRADVADAFEQVGDAGHRREPGWPLASVGGVELNRVRLMKIADTKNEAALMTNATLRPESAVTRPPIEAPAPAWPTRSRSTARWPASAHPPT